MSRRRPVAFTWHADSKPAIQRILSLVGGPAANFLVAMILITGFGLTQLNSDPGLVLSVLPNRPCATGSAQLCPTPAALAGVRAGDRVRSVNGKPLTEPGQILKAETTAPGQPLVLSGYHSDGTPFTYTLTPVCDKSGCLIGIGVAHVATVGSAIVSGVTFPFAAVGGIVTGLGSLITGSVPGGLFGPQGLTGPIGIADVAAQSVSQGPPTYIFLVALLSVALGFTNLLPLLALDGGRIVVVIIEWLRRRPFDRTMELNFHRWGLVALLGLAAVISFLDIQRIATGQFPGVH